MSLTRGIAEATRLGIWYGATGVCGDVAIQKSINVATTDLQHVFWCC